MFRIFTLLSLLLLIIPFSTKATVCTDLLTGNWSNTFNWSCGALPVGGDTIVISTSTTESFDMGNYTMPGGSSVLIQIYGTLQFTAGSKLNLPANSNIIIYSGGSIKGAGGGGNSNYISMGGTSVWKAGDGNQTGPLILNTSCTAGSGGCPLPVTLVSFTGKYSTSSQQITLNWVTSSETHFAYYEIWKSSDGKSFSSIDRITGEGVFSTTTTYHYTDNNVQLLQIYYYKLKQVDVNGSYTFSDIIAISTENTQGMELLITPNPVVSGDNFEITITGAGSSAILKIADISGHIVFNKTFNFTKDFNVIDFTSEEKLLPGTYIATIVGEGVVSINKKLIIW
jgi:hypothetical protein